MLGETSPTARPSEVANSIRRWWRICQADKYVTAHELWKAESELWGSAENAGRVTVFTKSREGEPSLIDPKTKWSKRAQEFVLDRLDPFPTLPPYAVFPWALPDSSGEEVKPIPTYRDLTFCISITCPIEDEPEIEEAMRAYNLLGGYGQRTNRGFGSLNIRDATGQELEFPHAHPRCDESMGLGIPKTIYIFCQKGNWNTDIALRRAVSVYATFNQGRNVGREQGKREKGRTHPGQSRFSEADTIRRMTGASDHDSNRISVNGFPRADLGLPRKFAFPEKQKWPPTVTLQGSRNGHSRFESPIITKVFITGSKREKNLKVYALIAIMDAPHVWEDGNMVEARIRRKNGRDGVRDIERTQLEMCRADLENVPALEGVGARKEFENYLNRLDGWTGAELSLESA